MPRGYDPDRYEVISTQPELGAGASGTDQLLWYATNKHALIEVHVDLPSGAAEAILPPPESPFYAGRQVPLF
ncbi:MAG: hypothetical protein AAFX81_06000 [Pseudomonadota bacterium]